MTVNGVPAVAKSKTAFVAYLPTGECEVTVMGNFMSGVKLNVNGEIVEVVPASKWYEVLGAVLIFVISIVSGNLPLLTAMIPVAGGALGGGISGAMSILALIAMKGQSSKVKKLIAWVIALVANLVLLTVAGALILLLFA